MSDIDFDLDLLEILLRYIVLPILIGTFALGLAWFYDSRTTTRQRAEHERREQLRLAKDTCDQVIPKAEALLQLMKYHAWNAAWRKMRPEGIFTEDLIEEDEIYWRQYNQALTAWRAHKVQYKTMVALYFGGKTNAASRLLKVIDATMDKLSFELWFIYHNNPNNPNVFMETYVEEIDQPYDSIFNAIMTAIDKEITREQEEKVHRATAVAFNELQDKIYRLSFEMSECIRREKVGTLRDDTRSLMK